MDRGQDVAATYREIFDSPPHFLPHILDAAVGQDRLGVNRTAKRQPVAKFAF